METEKLKVGDEVWVYWMGTKYLGVVTRVGAALIDIKYSNRKATRFWISTQRSNTAQYGGGVFFRTFEEDAKLVRIDEAMIALDTFGLYIEGSAAHSHFTVECLEEIAEVVRRHQKEVE